MRKIKKNDDVIVIAGKDKGSRGNVLRVLDDRLLVSGVNKVKKHQKPNPVKGEHGRNRGNGNVHPRFQCGHL